MSIKEMTNKALYIFDLDGTLALTEHRQHILKDTNYKERWAKFFAACVDDEPNTSVLKTLALLRNFADVKIWSGRSNAVRKETVVWLAKNSVLLTHEIEEILSMRVDGDYTPDEQLKQEWLLCLSAFDRSRLVAVFDDRNKVVEMWRKNGVDCFQVADGKF